MFIGSSVKVENIVPFSSTMKLDFCCYYFPVIYTSFLFLTFNNAESLEFWESVKLVITAVATNKIQTWEMMCVNKRKF